MSTLMRKAMQILDAEDAFAKETVRIINEEHDVHEQVIQEVKRLIASGAVDPAAHHRGILFGVAIENVAERWIVDRKSKEYKNLKRF